MVLYASLQYKTKEERIFLRSSLLIRKFQQNGNSIGRGGVYGATAAIFPEENPIF